MSYNFLKGSLPSFQFSRSHEAFSNKRALLYFSMAQSIRCSPPRHFILPLLVIPYFFHYNVTFFSKIRSISNASTPQSTAPSTTPSAHSSIYPFPSLNSICSEPGSLPPLQPLPPNLPSLFRSYLSSHAHTRAILTNRLSLPSVHDSVPRLLIWRCIPRGLRRCPGLGDRMRGLRFALALAVVTNRTLLIDWESTPYPLTAALVPASLDWTIPSAVLSSLPYHSAPLQTRRHAHLHWYDALPPHRLPLPSGGFLDLSNDNIASELEELPPLVTISTVFPHSYLLTLLRNPHMPTALSVSNAESDKISASVSIARMLTRLLFVSTPAVDARVSARLQWPSKNPYVGAHLRTGRDLGEADLPRFSALQNSSVRSVALQMLRCVHKQAHGTQGERLFALATDSTEHATIIASLARDQGIMMSVPTGPTFHFARPVRWHATHVQNDLGEETCERFLDVFVDLIMLARADVLVATRSGFADAAFFMGRATRWSEVVLGKYGEGQCMTLMRAGVRAEEKLRLHFGLSRDVAQ